jgi:anti-anti-sigma factor
MTASYAIQGELTVFTAHELKTALLSAMPSTGALQIDLGEVSEFDGAGLQLLLAAGNEAKARGGQLVLADAPERVDAVLRLTGLQDHFAKPASESQEITS